MPASASVRLHVGLRPDAATADEKTFEAGDVAIVRRSDERVEKPWISGTSRWSATRPGINISSRKSVKLIKEAVEIYYPGLPHGLTATHAELVNRDLLAFCQQGKRKVA